MPHYIRLIRFSDKAASNLRNFEGMLNESRSILEKHGVKLLHAYATLGRYDGIAVLEAPDQGAMAKASAAVAAVGNFRAETLAAVPIDQFAQAVKNL